MIPSRFLLLPCLLLACATAHANRFPAAFDTLTPRLMRTHKVPGVSIAWIQNHEVVWLGQYGVKVAGERDPVVADTTFEAASMSKPVFAYLCVQQLQAGRVDLDTPLVTYLGSPYPQAGDGHELMTLRHALSHSGGMPNWRPGGRRGAGPIPQLFAPGTDFTYSGEGMWFAQQALEKHLGIRLDEWAQRDLLGPLGMRDSSYVWRDAYQTQAARGHNRQGTRVEGNSGIYRQPNAAFSLYTTPADFAKYMIEMMRADRSAAHSINAEWRDVMLSPITRTTRDQIDRGVAKDGPVYFGLGWRIEETPLGRKVMHTGSNAAGFRCFSEFDPATGNGVVIMTNSAVGNQVYSTLRKEIGGSL